MQVLPGVHQVPNIRGANLFLIEDKDGLTLVDSGLPGNTGAVLRYVHGMGREPRDVGRIILTHGHPDHTGSARALRAITGAKVLAHEGDSETRQGARTTRQVGIPRLFHLPTWRCAIDGHISGGDTLPVLGGLRVVGAPGHTPGSVCLLAEREGILFIGDLLSHRRAYVSRSVPFPETDLRLYHESLERVAALDFETVCFGHGSVLRGGAAATVREAARWYADAPWWRRALQAVPGPLRLGLEVGYRHGGRL